MVKVGVGDASSRRVAAAAAASSASRRGPDTGEGIPSKPKPAVGGIETAGVALGVGVLKTVAEAKAIVMNGASGAVDGVTKPWDGAARNDAEDEAQAKPGTCSVKIEGDEERAGKPGGCTVKAESEEQGSTEAGAWEVKAEAEEHGPMEPEASVLKILSKGQEPVKPGGCPVKAESEKQSPMEPRPCAVKAEVEEHGPVEPEAIMLKIVPKGQEPGACPVKAEDDQALRETKLIELFNEACCCMEATEQDRILRGILLFRRCEKIINELGFLSNKENISTDHLKYILVSYYMGDLNEKVAGQDRMTVLSTTLDYLKKYVTTCQALKLIPDYELEFCDQEHSVATANQRKQRKVARFKRQRAAEVKLKEIENRRKDAMSMNYGSYDRERWLTTISLGVCKAFDLIEVLTLEEELEEEYDLTCLHDLFVCEHECAIPLRRKLKGITIIENIEVPGVLDIPSNDIEPEMSDPTPLARTVFQGMVDIQYRLHKEKLSLNGCFTFDDFYWTDQKKIKLSYHLRKLVSRRTIEKVRKDYSVNHNIILKDILGQVGVPLPTDLIYVMTLMLEDPIRGEALLRYNICWMDHINKMAHFITMYQRFRQLQLDPKRSYKCKEVLSYILAGDEEWRVALYGNEYLTKVHERHGRDSDPAYRNPEPYGAEELLEFVRHCITHVLAYSLEDNRIVLYEVHVYYIIESCFNGVFVQFQRGMHAVGELEYPHLIETMKT